MIPLRCLVLAVVLGAAANTVAQAPAPTVAPVAAAAALAGDERAAKLAERYEAMLAANPSEGIALDRLWKIYEDHDATAALIDEYRQASERDGGPARLVYGYLLKKTGRFDAAAAVYAAAGLAEPANPLPLLARAEVALAGHHPEDAAPLFSEALDLLPPNDRRRADVLQKLGSAWLAAGQPARAAESWEQLVAANPANLALHKLLADTYARNHLVDQALTHLEYLDQHAEPAARAAALRDMGRLHEARGDFDPARDAYERGLALTARDNWLHGELLGAIIRLYERAGRVAELEARWRQAAGQTPRDLGGYLRLETLAESQGDAQGELEWLDRITALAPRDRDSRLKLARRLVDRGQRERAAAVYDQLLKEQPDQLDLILARADLDLQMGAPALAVSRVEARLAKTPADETVSASALEFFLSRHLDEPAERCLRAAARPPGSLDAGIALAKFYFARHRPDEGRHVLDGLAGETGGSTPPLDRWQRVATAFKDENLLDDSLRCWWEAARVAPRDPAPLEAASELLLARGEPQAAADALEKAVAVVPEGPAREEVERKLFQVLSAPFESTPGATEGAGPPTGTPRRRPRGLSMSMRIGGLVPPAAENSVMVTVDGPLDQRLGKLEDEAERQPTAANLLRLARWQLWARLLNEAADSAEKAIARDPTNLPARQMSIRVATEAHEHGTAERRLREIIALDPARRPAYLRQLAGLQMEDGDFDAAISGYSQLQEMQPGAVEPLTDLALAQQRAERWFDALATWRRAYALPSLTPAQRGDVRRPLVAAYEHLGEFRPAAELLGHAVEEQPDLARKQELFQELSEFCGTHALADWLAGRYEARLQAQPEDYFTMVAVAGLWKNQGRDEEAYRLLRRAYYSAPDPVAALKSLADEAEAVGEDDQAVADRRRLVGIVGQDTPENLAKLAASEEDALDEDGAARTWEGIAARFPRDTNALAQAAEFFERIAQPDRARALLGRLVAIEPEDLPRLFHLAELARDAGDEADAHEKFGQVLAHSTAEKPGGPLRLPPDLEAAPEPSVSLGGMSVFYRSSVVESPLSKPAAGADDQALRLQVIRELAALLPGRDDPHAASEARNLWLEPWRKAAAVGARSEPLQAFYAAGDVTGTMDLLSGWLDARPTDERLRGAFLLAGLRLGDYGRLARWTWPVDGTDRSGVRGSQMVAAVQQFLAAGGHPGANIAAELFPPHVKARDLLWRTAKEGFAERRWYALAAELGERVLALAASNRSAYAVELAQWELFLNRPDQARAVLREAVDEGGGASLDGADGSASFDGTGGSAVYEALRAYYLLLPADQRAAFVDGYLRGWQARGQAVHGVLSAVLLHGLQGDGTSARRDLDALLALGLAEPESANVDRSPAARRWSYVLGTGVQLENWNLGSLATYLWRRALEGATAFDRRDGEVQGTLAEINNRLVVLEVATAPDPEAGRERLSAYLAGRPRADLVRSVATQLLTASQFPAARQCYESLTRQEPGNEEDWRNLLVAYNAEGDLDDMETALVSLLGPDRAAPSPLTRAELVRDLAVLRQFEGDAAGATRLLEREFQDGNRAAPVVTSLAASYERAGLLDDVARVWQEGIGGDYANARTYRLALARLAERRGNLPQAISWLEAELAGKGPPGAEAAIGQLAGLYLQTGRTDQAKDLALGLLKMNSLEGLPGVVQAFAQAGQQPLIREWLRTAVRRARDPQTRFQLQQQVLQKDLASAAEPAAEFAREMRRLERFSLALPALRSAYETARYALARQRGADHWLEGELQHEWREGRGEFTAGEQLVSFYLDTRQTEPLRRVVQAIDARPNLPEQSLAGIEKRLTDANLAGMALPLSERLFRRFPQNDLYGLDRAKVLWKTGQTAEADRLLEALDGSAFFREDLSAQIGALYEELGETERARSFYVRAVPRDPSGVRSAAVCLRLAQIETRRKNLPEVRRLLQIAYRHPEAANDLTPLVNFLQASGELGGSGSRGLPGTEFPLTFTKRGQLLTLVYQRLKTLGRLPEAQAMVAAHPGFLAVSPALAAAWQQDAKPEQVSTFIALLNDAAGLLDGPTLRQGRDLAALYLRWSDDEANANPQNVTVRLEHLASAQRFAPDDFEVARRLAALCWENHQADRAVAALQPFLAYDAVPAEREQARTLLARH